MKRTFWLSAPLAALLVLCAATAASAMYHPTLGRFVQRDPIEYADGMSLYEYVGSMPLGSRDPLGMREFADPSTLTPDPISDKPWSKGGGKPRPPTLGRPMPPPTVGSSAPDWAGEGGYPAHHNLGELISNVNSQVGRGQCIGTLEIDAHGNPDEAALDNLKQADGTYTKWDASKDKIEKANVINDENAGQAGEALANLPFCCKCKILLYTCNAGRKMGDHTWPQVIADKTGCMLYAPMGYPRGRPTKDATVSVERATWRNPETEGQLYESEEDRWRRFEPKKRRTKQPGEPVYLRN
ncbi:MAG: hypothetical protein IMZ44_07375 [Planctomycetes bacterium]|nr:hypothetical protein [Planctomycetota bacterium]